MEIYRYLSDFNDIEQETYDVIIIGSGIAGVYTAIEIEEKYKVAIFTKETLEISNSVLAQGGIAVSLDKEDSPELHFKDTIYAGAGLCDEESVWFLVNNAESNIKSLCRYGVNFDKEVEGDLSLTREAAHSKNRIIHAGDTTGKEVCDKLILEVKRKKNVEIFESHFVLDLLIENSKITGVIVYNQKTNKIFRCNSNVVICATGGFGQAYKNTTNPEVATGDGICLAYRAGIELMDLEFIQFHPTVLYHNDNRSFLISEAVRGEGAILKNAKNECFMKKYHELCELAPRDVVSRSIFREMKELGTENVYLDITHKDGNYIKNRFPNIFKTCLEYGIDMTKDMIPVSPAEHYCMGGIKTNTFGETNIEGFFACGEAACNGIHGANRLASNSLLEGLVFGSEIGKRAGKLINDKKVENKDIKNITKREIKYINRKEIINSIKNIMSEYVGIIRNRKGLEIAKRELDKYYKNLYDMKNLTIEDYEMQNILLISKLVVESAIKREESRGAHYRSDFENTDNQDWKRHIIQKLNKNDVIK